MLFSFSLQGSPLFYPLFEPIYIHIYISVLVRLRAPSLLVVFPPLAITRFGPIRFYLTAQTLFSPNFGRPNFRPFDLTTLRPYDLTTLRPYDPP